MICISPLSLRGHTFPCGRCASCNYNYRKGWEARMRMESKLWSIDDQAFVTLTYEKVPINQYFLWTLRKTDLQKFFKRCRKAGYVFRYLAVGEYGTRSGRPHYHIMIWGLHYQLVQQMVHDHWNLGMDLTLPVHEGAHQYVSKYILKGCEYPQDNQAEFDTEKPFKLSSKAPGIGVLGLEEMGQRYLEYPHYQFLEENGDISTTYRSDGRWWSLPYRDASIVREAAGVPALAEDRPPKPIRTPTDEEINKAKSYLRYVESFKKQAKTF